MKIKDLKELIGERAIDIIVNGLNLECKNGIYDCPIGGHKKGKSFSAKWYADKLHFFCHDCNKPFDISDFAVLKGDRVQLLHDYANIQYNTVSMQSIPIVAPSLESSGYNYLRSRGISADTMTKYKVTSDAKYVNFNYYTPKCQELVKIKQRIIGDVKNGADKYTAPKGGTQILYGMQMMNNQKYIAICEGEIESLSLYECFKIAGGQDSTLCVSMPNGSGYLGWIDTCKQWLEQFEGIILVPDKDKAGQECFEKCKEKLSDYNLFHLNLPDDEKIKDVNDFLNHADYNPAEILKYLNHIIPEIKGVKTSKQITPVKKNKPISSGYITQDYNDGGLKGGNLLLLTGASGDGKTSYARQYLIAIAKQRQKVFMFYGESIMYDEKNKLARLCAPRENISKSFNMGGRAEYSAKQEALDAYEKQYGDFILMTDKDTIMETFPEAKQDQNKVYEYLLMEMEKMVKYHGIKYFILDNLMVLVNLENDRKFARQAAIAGGLKAFANKYGAFICLIVHPRKGSGQQDISGAAEVLNIADSAWRYVRLNDQNSKGILPMCKLDEKYKQKVSAVVFCEKIRDDGSKNTAWIEWDTEHGAIYDLSTLPNSRAYEERGFFTRSVGTFTSSDYPENV